MNCDHILLTVHFRNIHLYLLSVFIHLLLTLLCFLSEVILESVEDVN
jgi:thiosulfate reductase cytochrome b subunit